MDWFWGVGFLAVVLGLVVLGKLVLDLLVKVRGDDDLHYLYDIIGLVLSSLEGETVRRLSELEQAEVEAAAREVYGRFIAGTPAVHLVDEEGFVTDPRPARTLSVRTHALCAHALYARDRVRVVVEPWRRIAGVEDGGSPTDPFPRRKRVRAICGSPSYAFVRQFSASACGQASMQAPQAKQSACTLASA